MLVLCLAGKHITLYGMRALVVDVSSIPLPTMHGN
jgi:hypothetical protein